MVHQIFKTVKFLLPNFLSQLIRSLFTALLTPLSFSIRSGHFLSSFRRSAVDRYGKSIPWYTYPCINFLEKRSFSGMKVLEFGGGQSSIWWGSRANTVVTFEGNDPLFSPNHEWSKKLQKSLPENVELHEVSMESSKTCQDEVLSILKNKPYETYDVIIIDGLYRSHMVPIALKYLSDGGIIVVDNSEGYELFDEFISTNLSKVEFYGYSPGVYLKSCTTIYFSKENKFFDNDIPIDIPL
jgi:hypothetical protein